ncbi:DNA mismatch endonuclease Vsr [Lysobacter soli]|uniref:very short patch repair endonuclease n=1 Tax=Lysobacter soli TaxID=453783 RepID=UPI0012ED5367|nr:very short patch repair endonuclease [Lysobacter soli]QGW66676.1 DNA mismatch endonuclease Vsr [Lysobacter soli]
MSDVLSPEARARNMRAIRARDTGPELLIRKALHRKGFRYRLHVRELPGTPDIVFPKFRAAVFVHGCFWHQHHCSLFKLPSTRPDFWREKIARNALRDRDAREKLLADGWRIATVWECALKGRFRQGVENVADTLAFWLGDADEAAIEIAEIWID